jgi:hypothetical protein
LQFLHPALLAGTLLFAVPLIIHLLNRQRHLRRPWAAMEFLLRAYRKQRRRLRRENLLLLLLRCLIPVLLALAVARPVLREAGALLATEGGLHHIVVLDGSYSMGLRREGASSPFEAGRGLAVRLLDRLQARREQNDKVTLAVAGVRTRMLVRGELNLAAARGQLLQVQRPEDAAGDLTEALAQVADLIEETADPEVRVYVLTDLQARAFGTALQEARGQAPAPEFRDTVRDVLDRLRAMPQVRVRFIDIGPMAELRVGGTADNAQVTGLRVDQPAAVVRVPVTVVATLRNRGLSSIGTQVTLEVDGGEPMRKLVTVEAGAEAEAEFQVAFRETGRHRLRATLPHDALEADDERFATVEVRDRIRILVVDGAADDDPLRTHGWLFRSILDPTAGTGPPEITVFDVHTCDTLALLSGQQSPEQYEVTVLADVDRVNERAAAAIRRALQAGKGVLCALGERVDPQSWNLHLHGAGDGPMPFRLLRPDGAAPGTGLTWTSSVELPEHGLLAEFDEPVYREVLQAIPVSRWHTLAPDSLGPKAQIPLRLTDARQSPLLVAHEFGEGKALFWLSAPASPYRLDRERWNRFDDPIVAFHLLHGMARWLALPSHDPFHALVGGVLSASAPARPEGLELLKPDREGGGKVPVSEDSRPLTSGRYALPPWPHTLWAGFYTFECMLDREVGKERAVFTFAVNVDVEEGELRYAAHDDVREALGVEPVLTGLPSEETGTMESERSELGPTLLFALLLLVLGEAAMARAVSVRRV